MSNNNFIEIQDDFYLSGFPFKISINEIEKNLGKPDDINIKKVKNIHVENQIDEIYLIKYEGLYFQIYKTNTNPSRELEMCIEVSSPKYKLKHGLNVGVSKDYIIKILGKPNEIVKEKMYYIGGEMGPIGFQFHLKNNIVIKIIWMYYID